MKTTLALASLALLGACASGPQQQAPSNWGYKPGESAPRVISETEFDTLTEQVVNLRAQRNTIAGIMRTSPDAGVRARSARDIDTLNENLRMLEYRLRAANRPLPRE